MTKKVGIVIVMTYFTCFDYFLDGKTVGKKLFQEIHSFFQVVNIETDLDWFGFDEIENINKSITSFLLYSDISAGKKAVIINKIVENKVQDPQYWGDFINKFDETDDLNLAFEMIENEKFGLRFATNFFSGSKEEKIADLPYKKAFYETLKNDPEIECNSSSGLIITQICKNNIDYINMQVIV